MKRQRFSFYKIFLALMAVVLISAMTVNLAAADVVDPSFESGAFAPNWTTAFGVHNTPLTGVPPFTGANVPPAAPGGLMLSAVLGPFAALSQTDAIVPLQYPAYGSYVARVNDSSTNYHQNSITQTFTIDAGNYDTLDGLYHLRMVYAPVLDSSGHIPQDQPFFWIRVTNNTTATILWDNVNSPGDPGIPWISAGSWRWLNWALLDVSTGLNNGDSVTIQITAADCDQGAHAGYVYVDAVGGTVPGPTITASAVATTPENSNIVYTFTYRNGSGSSQTLTSTVNLPPGTTFVSADPACSGTGPITCSFPGVAAGGTGTFQMTVHVPGGTAGTTVVEGNYNVGATGFPTLTGPAVSTNVTAAPAPTLLNLTPPSGPVTGGTTVIITGTGLTGGTFTFGGSAATCTVNPAGTSATCTTPPHAEGLVNVVVTTPGGTTTLTNAYTFVPLVAELPRTGFAPGQITQLGPQTVPYADLGDLWLEIPRLGVQMPIVGVPQANGDWDVSWLGSNAGWLQGSAFPSWAGNSVLTGHVWDANNRPGPFANLSQMWYGDRVIVHAFGQEYVYEVRSVRRIYPDSANAVFKHEDLPWLTLLTCSSYSEDMGTYRYRLIVRAVQVEVR